MPQRFARADMIIHMEMGRWGCLLRYLKRCFTTRWGLAPRYGASEGVTDEFNWAMVKWIMVPHKVDTKWTEKQALFDALLNEHAHKIITIRSFDEVAILVKQIERSNTKENA